MPLYVIALTDTDVPRWSFASRAFRSVKIASGLYAVCETRDEPPPPTDDELRLQHAAVIALSRRVEALLPARFGSLIDRAALARMFDGHLEQIREALDDVRSRVQMTVRVLGRRPPSASPAANASGRDYLTARHRALEPPLPPAAAKVLEQLEPLVVRSRREHGGGQLLATVYHLVNAKDVARYKRAARGVTAARVVVTGPWPPFAFTPRIF